MEDRNPIGDPKTALFYKIDSEINKVSNSLVKE